MISMVQFEWCANRPYALLTARQLHIQVALRKMNEQHILLRHVSTFSQSVRLSVGAMQWTHADQYQADRAF